MPTYTPPAVLASYNEDDLNELIVTRACSKYHVECGCYGGPQKT